MLKAALLCCLLAACLLAGCGDYTDAVAQAEHYCSMVKQGAWPAYNDSINCTDKNNERSGSGKFRSGAGVDGGKERSRAVRQVF